MWYQAQIYTETSEGLEWRGPTAAACILFVLIVWGVLAARTPRTYRPFWEFNSTETLPAHPIIRVPDDEGKEKTYRPVGEPAKYYERGNMRLPELKTGSSPKYVTLVEEGEDVKFEPERDEKGNFLRRKSTIWGVVQVEEPLRYVDDKGRVMREGSLGRITLFKGDLLFVNLLLNVLLLAACFLGLWLLVRFQWPDALIQAVVLWLVLLFVVPTMMSYVETVTAAPVAKAK
jgi:hypothetical protein